jgi:hypothetical protein
MKLKSLLKEYSSSTKVYADGIQFILMIKIKSYHGSRDSITKKRFK